MTAQPDDKLANLVELWRKWDKNEKTLTEVNDLAKDNDWETLGKIMSKRLEFGTAGIRGRMGPGFGQMNDLVIVQVTQGLLSYLSQDCPDLASRGVVLGYDGRHNSSHWAELAAGVFLRSNVPVFLFRTTVPTPYVPFTILERSAAAGIMITASHNPKWDNGYKVYWANGAQILSPHVKNIQKAILDHLEPHPEAFNVPDPTNSLLMNPLDEISSRYLSTLPINNSRDDNGQLRRERNRILRTLEGDAMVLHTSI